MNRDSLDFVEAQEKSMPTGLQPFTHKDFGTITVIEEGGEPWFIAKDISEILNYAETSVMLRRLEKDEKVDRPIWSINERRYRSQVTINESGLYEAIWGSHMPKAKDFKRWIKRVVLPSIRKTGGYKMGVKPNLALKPPSRSKIASDLVANHKIAKFFGLSGNQALLSANNMVVKQYKQFDINPLIESEVELVAEKKIQYFTPTELGEQLGGVKANKVNLMLEAAGFQEKIKSGKRSKWVVTEKGKTFCQMLDVAKQHHSGAPVLQMKWDAAVLEECVALEEK